MTGFTTQIDPFQAFMNAGGHQNMAASQRAAIAATPQQLGMPTQEQQVQELASRERNKENFGQFGRDLSGLGVDLGWFPENSYNQLSHFGSGNKYGNQFDGQTYAEALAESQGQGGASENLIGMLNNAHTNRKQSTKALGGFSPMMAGMLALGGVGGLSSLGALGAPTSGLSQGLGASGLLSGGTLGSTGIGAASAAAGGGLTGAAGLSAGLSHLNAGTAVPTNGASFGQLSSSIGADGLTGTGGLTGGFAGQGGTNLFGNLGDKLFSPSSLASKATGFIPQGQGGMNQAPISGGGYKLSNTSSPLFSGYQPSTNLQPNNFQSSNNFQSQQTSPFLSVQDIYQRNNA